MKEMFFINDTPGNRITGYLLLAFLVALPFDRFYSELILIVCILHTLIQGNYGPKYPVSWPGFLLPLIYLVMVFSTFYSKQRELGYHFWEIQLALLVLPLFFCFTTLDMAKYAMLFLRVFAITCFFTVSFLFLFDVHVVLEQQLPWSTFIDGTFMNQHFIYPLDIHATYLSMYVGLSLAVFLRLLLSARSMFYRAFYLFCFLILSTALLQLASRAVCFAWLLILLAGPFFLFNGRKKFAYAGFSLACALLFLVVIFNNAALRERLVSQLHGDLDLAATDKYIPEPRIGRWACAWELIRESPVIGYGSGMEVPLLKEKYLSHRYLTSYQYALNAHNQFISLWINTGLPGVLIYVSIFLFGYMHAIRRKDFCFFAFLTILFSVSLSENIFGLNKGIFFFAFFYPLFLSSFRQLKPPVPQKTSFPADA